MDSQLFTISEVAERLGTSERHVREFVYRRDIPYIKVGHLVRFDSEDIKDWIADRRVAATAAPVRTHSREEVAYPETS